MLYKLLIIAKNTFTEILRQPIYIIIISLALFLLLMSPSITMLTMDEDIKLLREMGLSTLFLTGLFIAIFSATGAVTEEIETRTITTVLSKPIGRPTFVIGKFLGVTVAVILAHYVCTVTMLMIIRHGVLEAAWMERDWTVVVAMGSAIFVTILLTAFLNYTYDWSFSSTFVVLFAFFASFALIFLLFIDENWQFNPKGSKIEAFDIYASVLLLFAIIVLVALAIMFSTRFNVVLTLTCCVGTFLAGLITDYLFTRFADTHIWAKIGSVLIPNLQVFWISDAIYEGSSIPLYYLAITSVYAILYTTAILLLAIAMFQKRQIG